MTKIEAIPALLDALETLYDQNVSNLRSALQAFASDGTRPDAKARSRRLLRLSRAARRL